MNSILILDNVRSVQNVGALFRTANCFGVSEIILCGITPTPVDRFGRIRNDFQKTSLGADLNIVWRHYPNTLDAVNELRELSYYIYAIEQSPDAVRLQDFVQKSVVDGAGYALVLGNEVEGIGQEVLELVDLILEIPQWGTKESLNVSNAGAIALYHLRVVADIIE